MHVRRTITLVLGCILATAGVSRQVWGSDRKVDLKLERVPLHHALRLLFQGTHLTYTVDPKVPNVPVTLTASGLEFDVALERLIATAGKAAQGLRSERKGEAYHIAAQTAPKSAAVVPMTGSRGNVGVPLGGGFIARGRDGKVVSGGPTSKAFASVNVKNAPRGREIKVLLQNYRLSGVLKWLFRSPQREISPLDYEIEPGVPEVTLTGQFSAESEEKLLRVLVQEAAKQSPKLRVETQNGKLIVTIRAGQP